MSRASEAIERLLAIMARLRAPDGCPWDLEQTLETLRPYVLEETYEVLEAIDAGDAAAHREELGDLLLQIVFQARLREEAGTVRLRRRGRRHLRQAGLAPSARLRRRAR